MTTLREIAAHSACDMFYFYMCLVGFLVSNTWDLSVGSCSGCTSSSGSLLIFTFFIIVKQRRSEMANES